MYGNICFKNSMKNTPEGWTCNCPVECNTLSYSFSIVSTPFDPQELCPERSTSHNFLMKPFYDNIFERTMIRMKYNMSNVEYCKTQLKYRAEVTFRLATDSMSVTVMSRRLTFYDKMSAFGNKIKFSFFKHHYLHFLGGTLGLFTGISILSLVEVVFWLIRYIVKNSTIASRTQKNHSRIMK